MIRFSFGKFETKKQAYHPFLIGILFLSNELRFNFNYYSFWECFLLIAIILAFCTFTFLIIKQILKNELKAGLISTSFIIINIFFHDIVNKLQEIQFFTASLSDSVIPADILYIPFLGLVWVMFCIYILKSKKRFQLINSYLNLVITIFILIEISKWIYGHNVEIKISDHTNFESEHVQNKSGKPDIYYIILDSYTSSESLNEFWNYDNSGFQDSLKKEGFYIANKSKSDYASTYFCMASYLNSSLLNSDSVTISSNQNLIGLIRNNKIIDFFNRQGYSIYNYSIFDLTGLEKYYDFFSNNYLDRTIWFKNSLRLKHYLFPRTNLSYAYLGIFPLLNKLNEQKDKRPFFAYAHIMMPHSPFYFDENGNRQITENKNLPLKIKYLKQLIFTNKLIYSTINQILANSKTEPIIIIQGDHGFRYLEDVGSIEKNREAHSILNAYYLPYGGNKVLNDSIRPVNTFRVILNYYFGMDLPMCQDLKP